jgi:hypothetical protein
MSPCCCRLGSAASFIQQRRSNCITREQGRLAMKCPQTADRFQGIAARIHSQAEHSYRVNERMERRRQDRGEPSFPVGKSCI